uniref:Peptidase A1 domain-containing protein n=1 Tax=Mola mola TaxID=94237 RepID=A0A3Q3VVP0_MOLML
MTGYLASDTVEVTKHPGVFGLSETEAPFTADMAADGILGFVASFDVMRVFDNVTTHGVVNSELGNKVVFGGVDSGHYTGRTTCICLLSATYCWINRDGYDENTKSQQNIKDCGSATSLIVGQTMSCVSIQTKPDVTLSFKRNIIICIYLLLRPVRALPHKCFQHYNEGEVYNVHM